MVERIRDVETPGGTVRVALRGEGAPVLLLHGLSANRRTWDAVVPRLEATFRLCVPDLPGRGQSEPRPELPQGLEQELERLRALLGELAFEPRIAVGHSQGAVLALALAATDPRVEGVVLVNPVNPWTRRPPVLSLLRGPAVRAAVAAGLAPLRRPLARYILRRTYGPSRPVTQGDVERYAGPYADPARARLLLRILADWRPEALERHLPARPLRGRVLAGARDRRIGLEGPARLAGRLGIEFDAAPGAGHVLPEEEPERVARAVAEVHVALVAASDPPTRPDRRAVP